MEIISLADDAATDVFYEKYRDKRCATIKKDDTVPNVGDTVRLNDCGLEQIFNVRRGMSHMKTLEMKIVRVDDESITYPKATFVVEVDNAEINCFLIDHHCFDIVRRADAK